jgi:hypothetical protein
MPNACDCDSSRLPYFALAGIETTTATRVAAIAGYIDTRDSTWGYSRTPDVRFGEN